MISAPMRQFSVQLCPDHSLPFTNICSNPSCECQIRLCEKCCNQHEDQYPKGNHIKIENYSKRVESQIDVFDKEYQQMVSKYKAKSGTAKGDSLMEKCAYYELQFEKFALKQVQTLQESMKFMNEEVKNVNRDLEKASINLTQKNGNIHIRRKEISEAYFRQLKDRNLTATIIPLLNQRGFTIFRGKLDKLINFRNIIKDFILSANKYGQEYPQFMKASIKVNASDVSMKKALCEILPDLGLESSHKNQNPKDFRTYEPTRLNNLMANMSPQEIGRKRRAKTIFGKDS